MVTINTAFSRLFINGMLHQKKVSTKASTSAGFSVCGTIQQQPSSTEAKKTLIPLFSLFLGAVRFVYLQIAFVLRLLNTKYVLTWDFLKYFMYFDHFLTTFDHTLISQMKSKKCVCKPVCVCVCARTFGFLVCTFSKLCNETKKNQTAVLSGNNRVQVERCAPKRLINGTK